MKILVAVPTYENIYPDTFKSIYTLKKGGHDVDFDFVRGYDVANARNQIAQETVDRGYDYVLMVDNDVLLAEDTLLNLLETEQSEPQRGMTAGYCLSRPKNRSNSTGRTTAFKYGGRNYKPENAYTVDELKALRGRGVLKLQIRGCGLPCALIHRSVFERMEYPWFKWTTYNNKAQLSEDLYFSEKFKEIGIPIFVDTRVKVGHLMRHFE